MSMEKNGINICYHPTTTVFVDDNQIFLDNLSLGLDEKFRVQLFNDPEEAISFTNISGNPLSYYKLSAENTGSEEMNDKWVNSLLGKQCVSMVDSRRFKNVSVITVDYDMPKINGLEVCARIKNPAVKKILLTGVTDERLAIDALNEGVINYYVNKRDPDLMQKLNVKIDQFQRQYFLDVSQRLKNQTIDNALSFINDPIFSAFFNDMCIETQVLEYYLMEDPCGFLLIGKNGWVKQLVVYTERDIENLTLQAQELGAPKHILNKMKERNYIPINTLQMGFDNIVEGDWDERFRFYPALVVEGTQNYFCAEVGNPKLNNVDPGVITDAYKSILYKHLH